MSDIASLPNEFGLDEAAVAARATIETALESFTSSERDAFWHAIGLYYATRRHPGADEAKSDAVEA